MKPQFQPWQFLLLILVGWINRSQQDAVEYLITENRILREKLGKKRILLNDDQRRRLAVKGKILGRKMLDQLATIATPETILRWHRELIARHWDYSQRRKSAGRPSTAPKIVEWVLRFAKEAFRVTLEQTGVEAVRLPPRSPNLNPHIERFMRTAKEECLGRMIFFGESSLKAAVVGFLAHDHAERNHQGLGNKLIAAGEEVGSAAGEVACCERFGGMLRYYYYQKAA